MSDSIKVAIKVRPLIKREEEEENLQIQWMVQGNGIVATDVELRKRGDSGFQFDHIFDKNASNSDVFHNIVKPIVDAAVKGFNGTVFAYGQTSSGKTYTMMGTPGEPGIVPLAVEHMFDAIANTSGREFLLRVSYLEIYNERVNDLLNKDSIDIKIHEDINGQVFVKCKEEVTNCPENVLSIMNKGNKHRRIGETSMNERSSRSHTIFRITIESREVGAGSDGAIQVSQLNMVDLAGSERARQTGATGERFKEGRHINLSLSTLALVIKQLSESQDCQKYINFRDSKLTRLLQASLGGNAMTAIICAVTPAAFEETQCTLSFAARARNIKNKPELNEVMSDGVLLKRYAKQIDMLQIELEKIKQQTRSTDFQKMESKLEEQEDVNKNLKERIRLLQTCILHGNNGNNTESFKNKVKRRQTWCGTAKRNSFQTCANLSPIKEMSPFKLYNRKTADIMDTSSKIALADFELELLNNEVDCEEEMESDEDTFVVYRKRNRVKFTDDVIIHKSLPINYNNCDSSSEKIDISVQTESNLSPDTPKKILRDRIHILTEEYSQLQEFTTIEKQVYREKHTSEIQEKLAKLSMLEKLDMENLASDMENFKHIASELREKLTIAESRYLSAEEKLSMQAAELQRLPDLEKKIAQLSTQEIEIQNIPGLQKKIKFLTAEKDGYEFIASDLRKKLNEAEQRNIILEEKLAVQNEKLEKSLEQSLSQNDNMQQVKLENQITTISLKSNELQHEVTDLKNELINTELCKNSMKDKLEEQRQHFQKEKHFLEECINDLRSEKHKFEHIICEMKNKLKKAEEVNLSMQDKLNEQQIEIQKFQNQEKQIKQLVSENNEVNFTIGELQEQLIEAKITNNIVEDKNNEYQSDAHKLHLEKQIQDVVKEKIESEQKINSELRNKLKDMELMNNQQKLYVQKTSDLEKQIENLTTKTNEFEEIVAELKEKLEKEELMSNLLKNKLHEYETNICEPDGLDKEHIISELQEKLKEAELYNNSIKMELNTQVETQKIIDEQKKCIEDLKKNDNEINCLKSRINDLQNIIQDINKENVYLKEQASTKSVLDRNLSNDDLSNGDSSKDMEDLSITRISLNDSSSKLSDIVLKTQNLENLEIKHDVQNLKADMEKLHGTIYQLSTENSDLTNKWLAEKQYSEESASRFQQTIDDLSARNLEITNEKLELQNNITILNEQIETLHLKIPEINSNEEQIFKYEEQIGTLTAKNTELLSNLTDKMKELEMLQDSKSLLYEHDCMHKDKYTELIMKHECLITENNELSTEIMNKIEENDELKEECNILKNKLELLLEREKDIDNNDEEQLKRENTLLKMEQTELKSNIQILTKENSEISNRLMETIEDLDNVQKINSCNNTLQLSALFNNTLTMNDSEQWTVDKSIKDDNNEAKISRLQEEVNHLTLLNRKLSDLKLGACTQCAHLQEMSENQRMLKFKVKILSHKLDESQRKFNREVAKSDSLILKAKEDVNLSICNSSLNANVLENMDVSYVEEKLQFLNNKLHILKKDHDKLSDLYKEKCNEVEELQNSSVTDLSPNKVNNINTSVKKSPSKMLRLDNMAMDMNHLQSGIEEMKEEIARVKKDLNKLIDEKVPLLDEIESLKITNEQLLQKSENELLSLEKIDILENEIRDMTKKLQEFSARCKEIEDAKLIVESEVEFLRTDKAEKERTINELRQNLVCLQHELDLTKREKEKLNSDNFLEQEYEKKLESLRSTNEELTNSKAIISQEFANYRKESENRFTELNEKINKYTSENDYLKQELIKLRDIENKFETMRNEYQSKSQQHQTLTDDNKKLKNLLNNISQNIIKEVKSLKPKIDAEEFLDKSVDELFQLCLQTIVMKEKEVMKTMRDAFNREKQKLEDDKQQSEDAKKRTTSWAKELENEIDKLHENLSQREAKSDGLQKEVARLEQLLEDNNRERDTLKEKNSLLETDLNNLQIEFTKYFKLDTVNEEAINIAQKRERQAQEAIKNKEAEFQMKLRLEKETYTKRMEDLVCTIESFKTKNMELTGNIEGLEANQEQLKNIIDLKNNELMKNNQIIHKLQNESVQLTEMYNELNLELEKKNLRVAEIMELLKTKCDDLTEYKAKLESIVSENTFLKQQVGERKASIEQYKLEIETLKLDNKKEMDAIKDKLNFEELKSIELNKQIAELNKKNAALTEEINTLRNDYATIQHKCTTLEKRIRNSTSKIQAEEQMEELKDLNRSLRNNLDGASNRITELQEAKAELTKQLITLNSQYDAACKDNQELKETLSSYRSRYSDTYATCEKYDALIQEKNKNALELEAIKVELDQKNKEIEDYISKIKELREKNAELDQESEELAKVICEHDAENARLEDQLWSCRIESDKLKDKIKILENKIQNLQSQSVQETDVSSEKVKSHDDECSCTALKNKIRELQMEVVSKNGKIGTLELQIRSGSFPYQSKCKELQEHLSAYKNKNNELKAEIKRVQLAMLRTSAKECNVCKQRFINRRHQICQTMPDNNILRFCGTSSGIIEDEIRITKLEKEKQLMKDICRSRSKTIKELEKQIAEYQKLLQ